MDAGFFKGFSQVEEGAMRALRLTRLAESSEKYKFRLYEITKFTYYRFNLITYLTAHFTQSFL